MAGDVEVDVMMAIAIELQRLPDAATRSRVCNYFAAWAESERRRPRTPEELAEMATRLLEEAGRQDPKARFAAMVASGLIDKEGKYRG